MLGIIEVFKNIWDDKRLLVNLSKKDFVRRFSGTYFGIMWAFVQPLLTILVYLFAFQFGFRSGNVTGFPYSLWFMCGIVPWLYISESISAASNSFVEYDYLIKKVKFNITILPLVKIFSALFIHVFFTVFVIAIGFILGYPIGIYFFQIIYYVFAEVMLLFAFTLVTSTIVVFFRDLNQIINLILLVGMWGTPIAWNPEIFPETIQKYFKFNPFYYIIEGYRDSILGREWFWNKPYQALYHWGIVIILLILGGFVFSRMKDYFAESV